MTKPQKIILFTVSGLVGLIVLIVVALTIFIDANAYKTRMESAASKTLGMDVSIGGPVRIKLFPDLSVTLSDVHVRRF